MKALLYAAGTGSRLGADYSDRHKVLLELGGRTLLDWHATRLTEAGADELVVVTGHSRALVERELEHIASRAGLDLRSIHNPDYTEGSVLSFDVSLPELETGDPFVLLMDADVLYPTVMLRRLIESRHRTALLVDRDYSTQDDDPLLVPIADGRPVEFRKRWSGSSDTVGESIGFFKIDSGDLPLVVEETRRRARGSGRGDSYDEVLRELVLAGRFGHEDVTGLPWTEIDFPGDVEHARDVVMPAILALED